METNSDTQTFFKQLEKNYLLFFVLEILAFMLSLAFQSTATAWQFQDENTLFYTSFVVFFAFALPFYFGNKRMHQAAQQADPLKRMSEYRNGSLILGVGSAILVLAFCAFYYIGGKKYYLLIAFMEIVYFALKRPNKDKITKDLALTEA